MLGRSYSTLNNDPITNDQAHSDIITCDIFSKDLDSNHTFIIKIKDDFKEKLPKKYHKISNTFSTYEECKMRADIVIDYLVKVLT